MSDPLPRHLRWILAIGERLVPWHRRTTWRRQWDADLRHRVLRSGRADRWSDLWFALGSLRHAIYLIGEGGMAWSSDMGQALRMLARRPGFTLLAALTMSLGIAAATVVFSLAESILLRPLPLEAEHELVSVFSADPSRGMDRFNVSYPDFRDFSRRTDLFQVATFYTEGNQDLAGEGEPERLRVAFVHERYFQTLRTPTLHGRPFTAEDHQVGPEPTVVLAEALWSRRFGSDSTVVGRSIRLDGVPHTVIGVVPSPQVWPRGVQAWVPLQWGGTPPDWADARTNHSWEVVARTREGVGAQFASSQIAAMASAIYAGDDIHDRDRGITALVVPLRSSGAGDRTGPALMVMGASVFLVLLIACVNASGLLLTRLSRRAQELSVRSALGAGRGRLARMVLVESLLLSLLGGAIGSGLAFAAIAQARRLAPPDMGMLAGARLNGAVLAATLAISLVAAVLAGIAPALRIWRSVAHALHENGPRSGGGRVGTRLRRGLVVVQVALSLALLVVAGLAIRGVQAQLTADPGFDPESVLTFTVRLPSSRYFGQGEINAYYRDAADRLESVPGVTSVALTSRLPLGGSGLSLFRAFSPDEAPPPPDGATFDAAWIEVSPEFASVLRVRPIRGRTFTEEDDADAPLVAIISESLASQMGGEDDLLGRSIRSVYDENLPRRVIGVIDDLQFDGLSGRAQPLVLVPNRQSPRRAMGFLIRTEGSPGSAIPSVRTTMEGLDPDVALHELRTLREAQGADLSGVRFLSALFGTFGAVALILAVSGVYGVVAFSVAQRRREFGVRVALGATSARVRALVLSEAVAVTGLGVAIGAGLSIGFSAVVDSVLFGLIPLDPWTVAAVTLLLMSAVGASSWVPAARATRVDPVEAMRAD